MNTEVKKTLAVLVGIALFVSLLIALPTDEQREVEEEVIEEAAEVIIEGA